MLAEPSTALRNSTNGRFLRGCSFRGIAPCLGFAAWLVCVVGPADGADYRFENPASINVSAEGFGPASPFPSTIPVSGVRGVVDKITITLSNLVHTSPADLDILLEGPQGQAILLLSDAGGTTAVTNVTLIFDAAAPLSVRQFDLLLSGAFRPANYGEDETNEFMVPPQYGATLSLFNDMDPNGDWSLFVYDDTPGETGAISDGWSLSITVHSQVFANPNPIVISGDGGMADPYPSTILVENLPKPPTKVTATLSDGFHPNPANLDVLLVSPSGQAVVLMSDAGASADDATVTLDDCAGDLLPELLPLVSGRYRPTNYDPNDSFPGVPAVTFGADLSAFNVSSPNGVWELYVYDDTGGQAGIIGGGWSLRLTIEPLAIVQQPVGQTNVLNAPASFDVCVVSVTPVSYQWRLNGAAIPGATNRTLTIPSAKLADAGSYSVNVANPVFVITSLAAPFYLSNVTPSAAPDDFADRLLLAGDLGTIAGTNFFATKQAGEPNHAGKPGGKSVWYAWKPEHSGIATFQTTGSAFDTLLAVYTGSDLPSLTGVASDDDRGGFFRSRVSFNANHTETYNIAIDGYNGQEGTFILDWSVESPATQPVITIEPVSLTVAEGSNAMFTVSATGTRLTYQWLYFGQEISGATSSNFTLENVQLQNVGVYAVRVRNATAHLVDSQDAVLEIGPNAAFQSRDKLPDYALSAGGSSSGPGRLRALSLTSGSSAGVFSPFRLGVGTFSQGFSLGGATIDVLDPNSCPIIFTNSQWLWLQVTNNLVAEFIVDTTGSTGANMLACYYCAANEYNDLKPIDCKKTYSPSTQPNSIRFKTMTLPSTTVSNYFAAVAGLSNYTGPIRCNVNSGVFLSIARSDANCVLSWYAPAGAYQLQAASPIESPPGMMVWSSVTSEVTFDRGTNRVTVPLDPAPSERSFRLSKL